MFSRKHPGCNTSSLRRAVCGAVVVAGIAWFGRGVCGQEAAEAEQPPPYLEDKVDENRKNDRTKVMQIQRAGTFGADERALFEAYYHEYYFARWSQRKNLSLLTAYRKELRTTLRSAGTGNVHYDHGGAGMFFNIGRHQPAIGVKTAASPMGSL